MSRNVSVYFIIIQACSLSPLAQIRDSGQRQAIGPAMMFTPSPKKPPTPKTRWRQQHLVKLVLHNPLEYTSRRFRQGEEEPEFGFPAEAAICSSRLETNAVLTAGQITTGLGLWPMQIRTRRPTLEIGSDGASRGKEAGDGSGWWALSNVANGGGSSVMQH